MKERGRFMDDLAGVAQGALSAFTGLKDEAEAVFAARVEAVIHKLDIARGEQLAAVQELAANARIAQEAADLEIAALKARVAALESKLGLTTAPTPTPGVDPLTTMPVDVPPGAPSHPMPGMPQDPPAAATGGAAPASPLA